MFGFHGVRVVAIAGLTLAAACFGIASAAPLASAPAAAERCTSTCTVTVRAASS